VVVGLLVASVLCSFGRPKVLAAGAGETLAELHALWFALGFVSIGLRTRFLELVGLQGGRPALAFTGAQVVNLVWALVLACLLFGRAWLLPRVGA
jgi:hypothetical protein